MLSQGNTCLNSSRLANDASKNFAHGAYVERAVVDFLEPLQNGAFAFGIRNREFEGETGSHVEQSQQLGVDVVDFFSPVIYVHNSKLLGNKKPAATFGIAAGSLKVLCF